MTPFCFAVVLLKTKSNQFSGIKPINSAGVFVPAGEQRLLSVLSLSAVANISSPLRGASSHSRAEKTEKAPSLTLNEL